jgi:hypothetical protein
MLSSTRNLYLDWLFALVESARPGQTFLYLFRALDRTKFQADARTPLDANRVSYALGLRKEFFHTYSIPYTDDFSEARISMLELLIQLAYDMGEITSREDNIPSYFFELLDNLSICVSDAEYTDIDAIDSAVYLVLQKVIKRRYSSRGLLFPLKHPAADQRLVELWFQMNAYLIEQEEHWTS